MARRMFRRAGVLALASGLALAATLVLAQTAATPGVHPVSGRQFATVMGWQGADWLERSEREKEEEPSKAFDAFGDLTGATVADRRNRQSSLVPRALVVIVNH